MSLKIPMTFWMISFPTINMTNQPRNKRHSVDRMKSSSDCSLEHLTIRRSTLCWVTRFAGFIQSNKIIETHTRSCTTVLNYSQETHLYCQRWADCALKLDVVQRRRIISQWSKRCSRKIHQLRKHWIQIVKWMIYLMGYYLINQVIVLKANSNRLLRWSLTWTEHSLTSSMVTIPTPFLSLEKWWLMYHLILLQPITLPLVRYSRIR